MFVEQPLVMPGSAKYLNCLESPRVTFVYMVIVIGVYGYMCLQL